MPIREISTENILQILQPIWYTITATASILQNRLEQIFDDAIVREKYSGQNPARWRKHLSESLTPPAKFYREKHHPALPYSELPGLITKLRASNHVGGPCLRFLILTNVRCKEVRATTWAEVDWERKLWTIPAVRMKGRREGDEDHIVPLSETAIVLLNEMKKHRINDYVFPGVVGNKCISHPSLARALADIQKNITLHGFRTTFRTWANQTDHRQDLVEICLAHSVGAAKVTGVDTRIRKAYLEDDPELRRPIMEDWAEFAMSKVSEIAQAAE